MLLIPCQYALTLALFALIAGPQQLLANAVQTPPTAATVKGATADLENNILRFSYELEHWLDSDKRPCDDFYGFVCGRTQNTSAHTQQQLAEQRLRQQKEKFDKFLAVDDVNVNEQLLDAELKLKQFYASCKNARSTEDLKTSHLYRMSGGWPAIDDSTAMLRKRRNMTWLNVISAFHDVGFEYFFRYRVDIKSNKRLVHLEPDDHQRYTLRKFEQLATDVQQEYAVEAGRARLVALETLSFERGRRDILKNANADPKDSLELPYSEFKSTQIWGETLNLDWDGYFRKILGKPPKATDVVYVRQLTRLKQLFEFVEKTTLARLLNWIWIDYLMDKSASECLALADRYFGPVHQHMVERHAIDKVQMAQMYANLGRTYDEVLVATPWIDEMTQQNSKQFLGRIIHLTLNGDAKLDEDYATLTVTNRNFYRNLEKCQRFLMQQRKTEIVGGVATATTVGASSVSAVSSKTQRAANEFMKIFLTINLLLGEQNLTAPLSYALVGERFAESMIAGGTTTTTTPGAWRSMDSEREFATLQQCIKRQQTSTATNSSSSPQYNLNDLVLKLLAQAQTLRSYNEWQQKQDAMLLRRIDNLLAAGRLQLSLRKLYFIGSVLTNCQQYASSSVEQQQQFVNSYLRNSLEFSRAFSCRSGEARSVCRIL